MLFAFEGRVASAALAVLSASLVPMTVSCSGDLPTSADASLSDAELAVVGSGVVHAVTGKGTVLYGESPSLPLNISFGARLMPDGSAAGSWHHQFRAREPGGRVVVQVTCLSVAGNRAWMAGYSTQAGNLANVGKWFGLLVIDHGEGHGVVDEMSRTLWFGHDAQMAADFCALMPTDPEVWPLVGGNVQVR